ncbi:WXG100 family type VII secretion target [Streptomyces anulatus]|uniref:WXG100 family type VII secretion target n=1 Tax=Streptomyces anulatus TaxID=1892 RepID=UPI0037026081
MSDENQQDLTPAEQVKQDEGRVQAQIVVTDMTEMAGRALESFGFGNPRTGGRTSFEGHQLNALIDMVENSNPEHLESAGEALWKARDAIRRAAKELKDHLKGVDWQGESGTAFRAFGTGLVAHAEKLGDFADAAGTQITVAGTGLASVKSAMPPRDSRMIQTDVKDILFPARTETNPQYAAALEVEKNRQEAINQINRLASYYSVSEEVLAGQEPPRFEKSLGIEMPQPRKSNIEGAPYQSSTEGSESLGSGAATGSSGRSTTGDSVSVATTNRPQSEVLGPAPLPDASTSTEINSVKAPPAPTTITGTPPLPSPTPTTGPTVAPPLSVPPPFMTTTQGNPARTTGPGPLTQRTVNPAGPGLGKAQPAGGGPVAKGPGGPPVGRPSPMGGGGTSTRPPVGPQSPITGRSTPTGGRPVTGQGGTSTVGGPRGGGRTGIVGGTPQNAPQGRTGAAGQRGVIGGRGAAAAASRPGGRPAQASGANGVVGAPRKAGGGGSNAKGFTAGGAGLVRGPAGRRNSGRGEEDDNGSTRPDYLTEDEETWNAGRRGAVPPVVE